MIEYVLNFNSLRIMALKTKHLLGGFRDCTLGFCIVEDMNPTHILSVVWPHSTSTIKRQSHRISTQYMYPQYLHYKRTITQNMYPVHVQGNVHK